MHFAKIIAERLGHQGLVKLPQLASFVKSAMKKKQKRSKKNTTAVRGLDRSNMDMTVEPNDNFYVYSNGNWMKNNPIPSGYSSWNTFQVSGVSIMMI